MKRSLINWWVWTARPFILHPIQTFKDWFWLSRTRLDPEDLEHLTEEERKALK